MTAAAGDWRAGTATGTITPEESLMMGGYWDRDGSAEGTDTDLRASVLALEDAAGDRAVVVGLDLLFVPDGLRAALVETCRRHGVERDGVLVNASHTHSGPEVRPPRAEIEDWPERYRDRQAAYLDRVESAVTDAAERAVETLGPATVAYGRGRAGFGMNRRVDRDGAWGIGASPDRPVDTSVPVFRVDGPHGSPVALAFGYACHATTLGAEFRQHSGDWVAHAKCRLRERYPEAMPLFLSGCAGDQAPFPRDRSSLARRYGDTMAVAVEAGARAETTALDASLGTGGDTVDLPVEAPDRATLEAGLDADDPGVRGRSRYLLAEYPDGVPDSYAYPIQRVEVGDVTLVGLAGEPVVEYADRLAAELDGAVWTAGYCHEYAGYVPTPEILQEGGYEGERWVENTPFPGRLDHSAEERIVDAVTGLD